MKLKIEIFQDTDMGQWCYDVPALSSPRSAPYFVALQKTLKSVLASPSSNSRRAL